MTSGRLSGKVAIVTGAGSGFGETIARTFVKEGAHVIIAEINETSGRRVEQDINNSDGEKALFHKTDVTSKSGWESLLKATLDKHDRLDILVNNAGTTYAKKPSHEVTEDEWSKLIDINMKSIFLSIAVVVPQMKKQGAGIILNTSSIGGLRVKEELVYYGASKTFVNKVSGLEIDARYDH